MWDLSVANERDDLALAPDAMLWVTHHALSAAFLRVFLRYAGRIPPESIGRLTGLAARLETTGIDGLALSLNAVM